MKPGAELAKGFRMLGPPNGWVQGLDAEWAKRLIENGLRMVGVRPDAEWANGDKKENPGPRMGGLGFAKGW